MALLVLVIYWFGVLVANNICQNGLNLTNGLFMLGILALAFRVAYRLVRQLWRGSWWQRR